MEKPKISKEIIIGRNDENIISVDDNNHFLLCGPIGTNKTESFAITNLLNWNHSAVVQDPTGEIFKATSGYRESIGQKVYIWNPLASDLRGYCYNPLDWINRDFSEIVDDMTEISHWFFPKNESCDIEAKNLLTGLLICLVSLIERPCTFSEIYTIISSSDVPYDLAVILDRHNNIIHPIAYKEIANFLQKSNEEKSKIIATINNVIHKFSNPKLKTFTYHSDFDLSKLSKEKITIYITLNSTDIEKVNPLIAIFYKQLIKKKINSNGNIPILLMINNFNTLGYAAEVLSDLPLLYNNNIKLCSVFDDFSQVENCLKNFSYSFFANSGNKIAYLINDKKTLEAFFLLEKMRDKYLSKLLSNNLLFFKEGQKPKFLKKINPKEMFKDRLKGESWLPVQEISKKEMKMPKENNDKNKRNNISYLSLVHDSTANKRNIVNDNNEDKD